MTIVCSNNSMDWPHTCTGNARFLLKPYMFAAPAIFKEEFRRKIQDWGYYGFRPKIKLSSAQNQTSMKQGDNICNYHAQLNAKLSSFTAAGPHLTNVLLPIGPSGMMKVDVITCISFCCSRYARRRHIVWSIWVAQSGYTKAQSCLRCWSWKLG